MINSCIKNESYRHDVIAELRFRRDKRNNLHLKVGQYIKDVHITDIL